MSKNQTILIVFLALFLTAILAFGGLAHALLPHEHSTNEAVTSLLHSALSVEHKKFIDAISTGLIFSLVLVGVVGVGIKRQLDLRTLQAISADATHRALRRGVLAYRRFR